MPRQTYIIRPHAIAGRDMRIEGDDVGEAARKFADNIGLMLADFGIGEVDGKSIAEIRIGTGKWFTVIAESDIGISVRLPPELR